MRNFEELEQEAVNKLEQEQQKHRHLKKRPSILLCGYTGAGKTSLIRTILGEVVPENKIGAGKPKTMGYDYYENDLIRIYDSRGFESGQTENEFLQTTRNFLASRQDNLQAVDEHIHIVWYAIQASGARVTDCDLNLIKNIFRPDQLVIVLTKCDAAREAQLEAITRILTDNGIRESRIIRVSDAESGAMGARQLVDLTHTMLPEAFRAAFDEAQVIDLERRLQLIHRKKGKAAAIVAGFAASASTLAVTNPLPLSDAAVLVPLQLSMLASLAGLYGVYTGALKTAFLPMVAKMAGTFTAASLAKLFVGLGQIINASIAGSLTAGMGAYLIQHFEKLAIAKARGEPAPELPFNEETLRQCIKAAKAGKVDSKKSTELLPD